MQSSIIRILGLCLTVSIAGCQTYADRPFYDPLNLQVEMQPRQEKRVQAAPSETAFALQFINGSASVSPAEQRAAIGFLQRRVTAESDQLFVDFGYLHETTQLAFDRRTTIAEIVVAAGFDPARVQVRDNVAGIAENEINLAVRRYLVTLPGCPDFTSRSGRTFDNRPHSNWGCATASNFGQMVAEPKDIAIGRGDTLADGEAMVLSIQRYRIGQTRALEVDDTNTAQSHGVEGSSGGGESK